MIAEVFIELSRIRYYLWSNASPFPADQLYDEEYIDTGGEQRERKKPAKDETTTIKPKSGKTRSKGLSLADEAWFENDAKQKAMETETIEYACDKKSDLFVMQQQGIIKDKTFSLDVPTNGSR
jgi:hypothetical protein